MTASLTFLTRLALQVISSFAHNLVLIKQAVLNSMLVFSELLDGDLSYRRCRQPRDYRPFRCVNKPLQAMLADYCLCSAV